MNEEFNELDNIITLTDENGEEVPFELLDVLDYEGESYVVLLPLDEEEDEEVLILHVDENEESEDDTLEGVTDEALLETLFQIFKERNQDTLDFAD